MLVAYEGLIQSAQEAFIDIFLFFSSWELETVASIVGEVQLHSIEAGKHSSRD